MWDQSRYVVGDSFTINESTYWVCGCVFECGLKDKASSRALIIESIPLEFGTRNKKRKIESNAKGVADKLSDRQADRQADKNKKYFL